jgi:hypothetical protein
LIFYPENLPNIFINADSTHIDIFISSALLDFVEATAAAFMIDALRDTGDTTIEGIGFQRWLDDMRELKGDPKSLNVPWPGPKNKDVKWVDQYARTGTIMVYKFLFAHELSHLKQRKPSVRGANELSTEMAVDRAAFKALLNDGNILPNFVINFEMAMWYYECLKGQTIREYIKVPGGPKTLLEMAQARNWKVRAEQLVNDWETACKSNPAAVYARGSASFIEHARNLLAQPSPDPNKPAASRRSGSAKETREERIQACLEEKIKRCIKSCIEQWGNDPERCRREFCTLSEINLRVWRPECEREIDRDEKK